MVASAFKKMPVVAKIEAESRYQSILPIKAELMFQVQQNNFHFYAFLKSFSVVLVRSASDSKRVATVYALIDD